MHRRQICLQKYYWQHNNTTFESKELIILLLPLQVDFQDLVTPHPLINLWSLGLY